MSRPLAPALQRTTNTRLLLGDIAAALPMAWVPNAMRPLPLPFAPSRLTSGPGLAGIARLHANKKARAPRERRPSLNLK